MRLSSYGLVGPYLTRDDLLEAINKLEFGWRVISITNDEEGYCAWLRELEENDHS
jgi:hypothetical protein